MSIAKNSKRSYTPFAAGAMAGMLFLFVCWYFKIFPFGTDYTLLKIDLSQQYAPMLAELYDLIKSEKSIVYSWSAGLGYSFLGNYINYLASPFTYIIFFFSRENIAHAISVIILLKTILVSSSFSYYLKKTFNSANALNVSFSLLYTFSSWYVAYHWNIMWLDILFCLPFLAVGIQNIIKQKKCSLYLLVLAFAIMSNYYMAYMVCIFSCIYFIYYYIQNFNADCTEPVGKINNFFRSGLLFAACSIAAALLSAAFLVPLYFMLKSSSATGDAFPNSISFNFNLLYFWANHFSGPEIIYQTGRNLKLPNVWCGMFVVLLLPLYIFSKKFSKKERIIDFMLIAFLILSLNLNLLNFIWHGFHFANGLNDRFAFLYIFVILTVSYKAILKIGSIKVWQMLLSGIAACAFIIGLYTYNPDIIEKYTLIISLGFTVIYIVLGCISKIKKTDKSLIMVFAVFFVIAEIIFSQLLNFNFNFNKNYYDGDYEVFKHTQNQISDSDEELLFRIETANTNNCMEPMVFGYNGISNFSSMTKQSVAQNQSALGMDSNEINSFMYYPQTPVYNSMFAIKYLLDDSHTLNEDSFYSEVKLNGEKNYCIAYKNKYYLPLGFCTDFAFEQFHSEMKKNPFEQQQNMFKAACGQGDVFDYCDVYLKSTEGLTISREECISDQGCTAKLNGEESGKAIFEFVPEKSEKYYVYIYQAQSKIICAGEELRTQKEIANFNNNDAMVLDLGKCEQGVPITIELTIDEKSAKEPVRIYAAGLNMENFVKGYNKLNQNTLNITEFNDTYIKGSFEAAEDCLLYTSIPYDEGWKVYIDGQQVTKEDVKAVDNAYLSVRVKAGKHTVEYKYEQKGLKEGIAISFVTAALLIPSSIIINKKRKKNEE